MAQVLVHGVSYELPESFTLKELRIVERYSGGQAGEGFEISKICAVIHIAIMRAKPEASFEEIQEVVDELPADELEQFKKTVESAGQSPPAEKPDENSVSSNGDSEKSSDPDQESESPENYGADLSGFSAFHANRSAA